MRIKKLELVGFKSFKDRTVIQFDAGITGIVGPNGCGKSNIVDALVWVMGEMSAKHLRGSSMEDVIFAGSEAYAPSGLSEVSLTLENDGGPFPARYMKHSEIMVTRRLHRSGETEYLINKEPARLRDIQEIFMDTGAGSKGFSIVEQGKIGEIITAKPEQRRSLIEEAAGITKFKARKKESQRKLVSTDQNLVRLQDITGELKRQIDSLQRQAKRAERYRELKRRIEDLDLWLSSRTFFDLKATADEAQRVFDEAQAQETSGEADLSKFETDLEKIKLATVEQEKIVEDKQTNHYELRSQVQKKEMDIQELRFEIEQARRNKEMTGSMLQEQQARKELLERDQKELTEKVETLRSTLTSLEEEYESKRSGFEEVQSRVLEIDEQVTTERRELFAVGQTLSSLEAKIASLESQEEDLQGRSQEELEIRADLAEKHQQFEERRNKLHKSLEKEKQMQLDLSSDADAFEVNRKTLEEQLRGKRTEVDEFKDKLNEVTSRLYGLENLQANFEGFEEGVKKVMLWQKQQAEVSPDGGVHFRPVAEVVEVPSDFELAMEAALGSRLQTLLSDNSTHALQAVDYLKEQQSGRSSFLAVDDHGQRNLSSNPVEEAGVESLLKDVVKSADSYEKDVQYLLDGVAIVDSIRTALKLRPNYPGWTFVTREGDTLNADGVLTGGAKEGADSGVLKRRREIKELSIQKDEWAGKLALASEAMKKLEKQLEQVTEDFEGVKKRRQEQDIRVAELKKDYERSETELTNANQAIERQDREIAKIEDQIRTLNDRLEELRGNEEESRIRKQELEMSVESLDSELKNSKLGFDGLQSEVTGLQVSVASKQQEFRGLENQLSMVNKSLGELDTQLNRMEEESEKSTESLSTNQILVEEQKVALENLIRLAEESKLEVSEARDVLEKQLAEMRELEQRSSAALKERNSLQSKMNEAQLKLEQARMKESNLIEQMRERYMIEFSEVADRYKDRDEDPVEAATELKDLREKLGRIGEVNLSAIEEYEETSQRYEFLSQQQEDLIQAKEQLRKVIDRINRICTKRFRETYDQVNERFQKVFPVLFGGGEARLELIEDPDKGGEPGIDIIAKPPGKKMQNVTLMSGGEKALTAVSLIFSIFLVKPSPYCLLDEVDAPLDDANVSRFNDLVREMAKRSQIIVVTHNKYTMDVAGRLYGVTMQERGVSKMVSVNLADLN